jgi:hypothetical protein
MERRFESLGVRWKIDRGNVHTPPAGDTGPNQLLLVENHFRNGDIKAVIQPVNLQPYLAASKKPRLECGLVGRFQDPDNYVTAGLGVHGEDLGIARVEGGHFERLASAKLPGNIDPKGRQFRLRLAFNDDEVTLSCDGDLCCHAKTLSRGGRCGLRADWTEAHFKDIEIKNRDTPCLVIGPIGGVSSATRERSDRLLKTLICPTLAAHGYNALRADQFTSHGDINDEIFRHLIDDELVIADLSEHNPNVYYELAIRHAVRKPFIHIIQANDKLPFDVQNMRTIQVDLGSAESIQRAVGQLDATLSSLTLTRSPEVTTPVPKPWKLMPNKTTPRSHT